MTVRVVTGNPGAGKTVFTVSKIIRAMIGAKFVMEGEQYERRVLVAGIRGLVLPHERLPHKLTGDQVSAEAIDRWNAMRPDFPDAPVFQRLPGTSPLSRVHREGSYRYVNEEVIEAESGQLGDDWIEVPCLVQNWWLWCRPGDVIVVDEVQFLAPRGTLGKKPPYWVQLLEIHRHYGVDFVFVTQHPQLIDTTIRALVGHHDHVRSIMGTSMCAVYTWDHAANPERFNLANKTFWKRGRKDYRLFHSAVAHVAPPAGGRSIVYVLPLMLLLLAGGTYSFTARWRDPPASSAALAQQLAPGQLGPSGLAAPGALPASAAQPFRVGGCYTLPSGVCRCILSDGRPYAAGPQICAVSAVSFDGLVKWQAQTGPLPSTPAYGSTATGVAGPGPIAPAPVPPRPAAPLS